MPAGSWKRANIKCPFYVNDKLKDRTITCEGMFDRSQCTHKFRRGSDRLQQMELFCAGSYQKCEIYRAIMEAKYPED